MITGLSAISDFTVPENITPNGDVGDGSITSALSDLSIFGPDVPAAPIVGSAGSYIAPGTIYGPAAPAPTPLPSTAPSSGGSLLGNLFTNLAAGAAAIGLATLGRGAGVSNAYASSSAASLLAKPGSVSPTQAALTAQAATTPFIFMAFIVVLGLIVYGSTRKKG